MGTPNLMINILLLMDNDLTEKQKKRRRPDRKPGQPAGIRSKTGR